MKISNIHKCRDKSCIYMVHSKQGKWAALIPMPFGNSVPDSVTPK